MKKLYLLICACMAMFAINAQIIRGFAGSGIAGYLGDGVPGGAKMSRMASPQGICLDANNNVYFVDNGNGRVRRVDAITGTITTVAGNGTWAYSGDGGPATSAALNTPMKMAIDKVGNLYITDYDNFRIRKVDVSGTITTVAGTGVNGHSGDGGPATSAQITYPTGIAVDPSGDVYFSGNACVRKIDMATGVITTVVGIPGSFGYSGDGGPATSAQLHDGHNIVFDAVGNMYLTDNNLIRKVSTSGIITKVAGNYGAPWGFSGDGGPAVSADLFSPNGLALDGLGNLFFADYGNNRVRKITPGGIISTVAGYGGTVTPLVVCHTPMTINLAGPVSVGFNAYGNMYIATSIVPRIYVTADAMRIADVDLNTRCTSLSPQFTVTATGGVAPYTYIWTPNAGNTVTLSSMSSRTPSVVSGTNANFNLTVTDNSGCPGVNDTRVVKTDFSNAGFDLAMRDSYFDMYKEPNDQASVNPTAWNIWMSPDVWNRVAADANTTHQMPASGFSNFMYTTIRNMGCTASPASTLKLYWTLGGAPETWPADWTTTIHSSGQPQGKYIGLISIPSIAPATKQKFSRAWTPPNPAAYFPGATSMDICFLARLEDGHTTNPGGMTTSEVASVSQNVTNNNNIVTRNTSVVVVGKYSPKPRYLRVGNARDVRTNFSIQMANQAAFDPLITSTLNQFVTATVSLGSLFDRWIQAGAHGQYSSIDQQNKTVTFDGTNTMRLDSIYFDSAEQMEIIVTFAMNAAVDGTQMKDETVHFMQIYRENQEEIVYGNYTYTLVYDEPEEVGQGKGQEHAQSIQITSSSSVKGVNSEINVFPNPAHNQLTIEFPASVQTLVVLTDITGKVVAQQEVKNNNRATFNIEGYAPGIYLYTINSDNKVYSGKLLFK